MLQPSYLYFFVFHRPFSVFDLFILDRAVAPQAFKKRSTLCDLAQGSVGEADEVVSPCSRYSTANGPQNVHPYSLVPV